MSCNTSAPSSIRARAPVARSRQVRAVMKANRGGDLKPEQILRSELQKAGLRFRKHVRPLPGFRCEADIVFPRAKLCVFVDGCFWHGCPKHFTCPKTNSSWWAEKIEANRARDRAQNQRLRTNGWTVLRVWEHRISKDVDAVVSKIQALVPSSSVTNHSRVTQSVKKKVE